MYLCDVVTVLLCFVSCGSSQSFLINEAVWGSCGLGYSAYSETVRSNLYYVSLKHPVKKRTSIGCNLDPIDISGTIWGKEKACFIL